MYLTVGPPDSSVEYTLVSPFSFKKIKFKILSFMSINNHVCNEALVFKRESLTRGCFTLRDITSVNVYLKRVCPRFLTKWK